MKIFCVWLVLTHSILATGAQAAAPNIVVILADDLG